MKIFIDGREADTDPSAEIKISLSIASLSELEKRKAGYSKPFKLPMTRSNMLIMGDCSEIASTTLFNQQEHKARIEKDGFTVMAGSLYLISCTEMNEKGGFYFVAIIGASKEWVNKSAATPLRKAEIDFTETISAAVIQQSWTWDKPVRFLPVKRDSFAVENYKSHLFQPIKVLSYEDYHPFLNVKSIIESVFSQAGYTIESQFISSEMFAGLYMSGNYPRKSVEGDKSKMDFLAGRFEEVSATANSEGRVYANPLNATSYTIKNIVDTADPKEEKNGVALENVFTRNGCFTKIGERVAFTPTHSVVVGFEFKIHYTADYYIESREYLKTFDRVYLWHDQERRYKVTNRNEDKKEVFRTNKTFKIVVFDHNPGDSYQFKYDEVTNQQTHVVAERAHSTFAERTQSVIVTIANPVENPKLYIKKQGSSSYVLCTKDWALYDGYVQERGETEVEVTIRTTPERIIPSGPKYFNQIYFGGAEPGMKFTLGKHTTVRPLFAGYPCEGSTVKFQDVAAHEINCLDLINALRHMFNLSFFTDDLGKKVIIEPRVDFYRSDTIVDWSGRIDESKPISISELGDDMPKVYTLAYQTGDGAVSMWNRINTANFGSHSWNIGNRFAKNSESTYVNPVFTASINVEGEYPDATAASLVQAGDQEKDISGDVEELNFPAKIVRYMGMEALPASQKWGWPSYQSSYPLLAFDYNGNNVAGAALNPLANSGTAADIQNGFTFCFEDRNSVRGLHRLYDPIIETCNQGKRVEAYLRLGPEEIEPFVFPNSMKHDFRALYRLVINGENGLYRLEEIADYDPKETSVKCVFIKEL